MEKQSHLDPALFMHVFERLVEFFHLKLLVAIIFTFISWTFNGETEILISIALLVTFDTVTGTGIALRNKYLQKKGIYTGKPEEVFSSRGIYKGPVKFTAYLTMLIVSRIADRHIPIHVFSPMMDTFLVSTEAYSILENFAKMGFNVPTSMISKLKALTGIK